MTYLAKPKLRHPTLPANRLGYTRRDYEGKISTLCAGCGHDAISAAIVQACWELAIEPHRVAKLSGRVGWRSFGFARYVIYAALPDLIGSTFAPRTRDAIALTMKRAVIGVPS